MSRRPYVLVALLAVVVALLAFLSPASSDPAGGVQVPSLAEHNALEARVTAADAARADLEARVAELEAWVATAPQPTPTPTEEPSPTPTEEPSPTPDPTPTQEPTPGTAPQPADFPTRSSVGPTVEPTVVSVDCDYDASDNGRVIENVILDCNDTGVRFTQDAAGVVFRNSVIYGSMGTIGNTPGDATADAFPRDPVFTVEDSRIHQLSTANWQDRAACCAHFVVRRSLIEGTHSGLGAHNNVTLVGNFITTDGTDTHSSGARILKNTVFRGNTIQCKPVTPGYDGGCSAAAVFYREAINGDPAAAFNLAIEGNYFKRGVTPAGEPGGPWNATRFAGCNTADDCVNISFTGNLFDLGWGTDGNEFPNDAGDVWEGNYWTDGEPALPGQGR